MQDRFHSQVIDNIRLTSRYNPDISGIPDFRGESSLGDGGDRTWFAQTVCGSLKRNLLIPRRLIFESSVRAGMPSFAAAPPVPETRPPVSARTHSIISFSCRLNTSSSAIAGYWRWGDSDASQPAS